jgi:hypothetical protein
MWTSNKLIIMKAFTRHIFIALLLLVASYGAGAQGIPRNSFRPSGADNRQPRFNQMPNAGGIQKVQAIKEKYSGSKLYSLVVMRPRAFGLYTENTRTK